MTALISSTEAPFSSIVPVTTISAPASLAAAAASGVLMGFSGVFLLLVGVFTKADLEAHLTVAVTYFLLNALAIMVSMVSDYRKNRFFMFSFNIILILIEIAATFGYTYKGEEVVYVLLTCAWCMVQGLSLAFSKHYNTESDNRMVIR